MLPTGSNPVLASPNASQLRPLDAPRSVEMQIDAAIGHPEGAAIHQPRATPWESRSRKHTSPDSALDQRLYYVLGQLRGFDPGCLIFCRLLSQSRCGERPLPKSCRTSALGCDCAMCTANGSSRSTPSASNAMAAYRWRSAVARKVSRERDSAAGRPPIREMARVAA